MHSNLRQQDDENKLHLYVNTVFPVFPIVPGRVPRFFLLISTSSRVPSFLLEINFQKIAFHYFINKNNNFY